jgi:two-component system, response regulator, stage 0 sporulation protein F
MKKQILIVDDEESVLLVLKNSLIKLGDAYQVSTASTAFSALEQIQSRSFDLVVTDYKMPDMDGLQLMEAIRMIQPQARLIMMTAYGTEKLEQQVSQLEAYRYLTKPLEISAFRQIVREALSADDVAISRPGILVLSDTRYRQVMNLLQELRANVGGRCIILTDANGQMIAYAGDVGGLHLEQIASLLCGGMATLQAAGSALDGDEDAIHLSYREGKRDNLYVVNIGAQLLLILIIEAGAYSSRLGSAWYYARQTAVTLRQTLGEADYATAPQIFENQDVDEAFDSELDKLFDCDEETAFVSLPSIPPRTPGQKPGKPVLAKGNPGQSKLMGFQEAQAQGLITADFSAPE